MDSLKSEFEYERWEQGTETPENDREAKEMKKFLHGIVQRTCGRDCIEGNAAKDQCMRKVA